MGALNHPHPGMTVGIRPGQSAASAPRQSCPPDGGNISLIVTQETKIHQNWGANCNHKNESHTMLKAVAFDAFGTLVDIDRRGNAGPEQQVVAINDLRGVLI